MGYTHYWTAPRTLTAEEWSMVRRATTAVVDASGVWIGEGMGDFRGPRMSNERIHLNGQASIGLDHETFTLTRRQTHGDFCKTARKPYDTVVAALLAFMACKFGYRVDSDGGPEDWEPGCRLASRALGEVIPNPLVVRELAGEAS